MFTISIENRASSQTCASEISIKRSCWEHVFFIFTARNATSLLQDCAWTWLDQQGDIVSGCIRMACDSLLTINVLQFVNRLAASGFLFTSLLQVVLPGCNKSVNIKLH